MLYYEGMMKMEMQLIFCSDFFFFFFFLLIFVTFSPFLSQKYYFQKMRLCHTTLHEPLTPCWVPEKN